MEANGGINRTLKPHEYDQMEAARVSAEADAQRQRDEMQRNMQQQTPAAPVHQMYPNPDHQAAQQQQQPAAPATGPQMPTLNPNARSFAGGLVAGIVIGGIAMTAIRKAQITIVPENGGAS